MNTSKLNRAHVFCFLVIELLVLGQLPLIVFLYSKVPDQMAAHFDLFNRPDFFLPRSVVGIAFTAMTITLSTAVFAYWRLHLMKKKSSGFQTRFFLFAVSIFLLLFGCQLLMLLWNLNMKLPVAWILLGYLLLIVLPLGFFFVRSGLKEKQKITD